MAAALVDQIKSRLAMTLAIACLLQLFGCGGGDADSSQYTITQEIPTSNELAVADRNLDLGINGDGMFALLSKVGGQKSYSRYGRLGLTGQGQLIHADGSLVLGRIAETPDSIGPIPTIAPRIPARATSRLRIEAKLDSRVFPPARSFDVGDYSSYNFATSLIAYAPIETTLTLFFRRQSIDGQDGWQVFAVLEQRNVVAEAEIRFDPEGNLDPFWPSTMLIPLNPEHDPIVLDLSLLHSHPSQYAMTKIENDGYPAGSLIDVLVDQYGVLTLQYDNGAVLPGGQLVLARFNVADRLTRYGEKSWQCIRNCQAPTIDVPRSPLYGIIQRGALNVYY